MPPIQLSPEVLNTVFSGNVCSVVVTVGWNILF